MLEFFNSKGKEINYKNINKLPIDTTSNEMWKSRNAREDFFILIEENKKTTHAMVFATTNESDKSFQLWVDTTPVLKIEDAINLVKNRKQVTNKFITRKQLESFLKINNKNK